MYSVEYMNKYIKVIDKQNNQIVASGKVIATKNSVENNGISFDNKWFFRETDRLKYEFVNFVDTKLCNPEEMDLKWAYLKDNVIEGIDVLRDFGYDELDEDIKDFVYKLNELSNTIKTTTSCCGHGIKPWYIEFEFSEFWDLSLFINVVEFFKDLILRVNPDTAHVITRKNIHLQLECTHIDDDYKILNEFCKKVEKEFKKKQMYI